MDVAVWRRVSIVRQFCCHNPSYYLTRLAQSHCYKGYERCVSRFCPNGHSFEPRLPISALTPYRVHWQGTCYMIDMTKATEKTIKTSIKALADYEGNYTLVGKLRRQAILTGEPLHFLTEMVG